MSDSHNCSLEDLKIAAKKAEKRGAKYIIHCGDMIDEHLGTPIFKDFEIWVYITDQNKNVPSQLPSNWHLLGDENRVVVINNVRIYVHHYMGIDVLLGLSGVVDRIHKEYGYVAYALCGHSHHQFQHSDTNTCIINPGAWFEKLCFSVINTKNWDVTQGTLTQNFKRVNLDED